MEISRNWTTAHFLVFDSQPWNCHGTSVCAIQLAGVLLWAYTEHQGPAEVNSSAILGPFDSSQFMLCPWPKSFFQKLCPAPFPPVMFTSCCSVTQSSLTPWTAACQAFLSFTVSLSLLKLMSIESVMPSNQLILCRPLLLLSSIFPSIRVFSNESVLRIRWPKYWSFSFNISPSNECSGLISF